MYLQNLQNARHLTPGKVWPALSLVGYPGEVADAVVFVFNDTLICNDAATMQAVVFTCNVGVQSVMLNGDVYKPSGTMSGSVAPSGSGVLVRAQELRAAEEHVKGAWGTFEALSREEAKAVCTLQHSKLPLYQVGRLMVVPQDCTCSDAAPRTHPCFYPLLGSLAAACQP